MRIQQVQSKQNPQFCGTTFMNVVRVPTLVRGFSENKITAINSFLSGGMDNFTLTPKSPLKAVRKTDSFSIVTEINPDTGKVAIRATCADDEADQNMLVTLKTLFGRDPESYIRTNPDDVAQCKAAQAKWIKDPKSVFQPDC